ncbi:Phage shock protein A [Evansella caseinilytica]|uniref:Phage shock protein A n=1 Tax=Evansella caseinilytica TaxID=1503961 RepID=A0A1H3PUE6_9BACI|nr:PspA/IM30 family protein [Evansella caseinilytica]SDZ04593.1 Phage shock protein A [Evansella caseinilytica]
MTNLFTRLKDAVAADMHELMDKKEAQNPIAALNQYLRQSEKETEKVRKLVERQYRLKEEFSREYEQALEMAKKRRYQASVAEKAGEEEMYQFALQEHEEYEAKANRIREAKESAEQQLLNLEQKYEVMKHKLKDMHFKRMELMGRENVARANYQINKVVEDTGEHSFSRFSDMERYIEGLEYKVNSAYYKNTFDSKIAKLEKELNENENIDVK